MRILIKIGGAQLEQHAPRLQLCEAIERARHEGHQVIVVHGGGNQIRAVGKSLGLQDRYHDGLRITDAATADVALMVLGGLVNRKLVQAFSARGVSAVGLTGADGSTFGAKPLVRAGVDLGFVGVVDQVNSALVETLLQHGHVPVIATVAPTSQGLKRAAAGHSAGSPEREGEQPFFNINADHAAGPLSRALGCDALLFLTDVEGVLDAQGSLMPLLTDMDCERLIRTGVASGGMQPKLEAAQLAAKENPHAIVKIASASRDDCVLTALRDGAGSRFFHTAHTTDHAGAELHG
jgi:acetylglutamate kinase